MRATEGLELRLAVTGSHLLGSGPGSRQQILEDGFAIDAEIDTALSGDNPRAIAEATGRITAAAAGVLADLTPDIVLILGDRYEIFAVSVAAALMEIPIAHIHGGEATLGSIDDSLRNAITKLSNLHFACADAYRARILQMGEAPDRVFNVGAPAIERMLTSPRADLNEVWGRVGRSLPEPFVVVTYHPETAGQPSPATDVSEMLAALSSSNAKGILFTGVNMDARHNDVDAAIQAFVSSMPDRSAYIDNLGQRLYWSAIEHSAAVVGNSSSGIIEAPAIGVPTVNIGSRQGGRLRAQSVIDCQPRRNDILIALERALRGDVVLNGQTPYRGSSTSSMIANCLAQTDVASLTPKPFHDIVEIEGR